MSENEQLLPGFWRFLWMYFMQPEALLIKASRIENGGGTKLTNPQLPTRLNVLLSVATYFAFVVQFLLIRAHPEWMALRFFYFLTFFALGILFSTNRQVLHNWVFRYRVLLRCF